MTRGERASRFVLGLLVCVSAGSAIAEEATVRRYALPDHGSIQLRVPVSWKDEMRQPPDRLPPTIVLTPKSGAPFEVSLTAVWPPSKDASPPTADAVRQTVQRAADQAKSQAVEKTIAVKELQGASGPGYYFSATDRAPAPGEYKYLTHGMIRVGDLAATFTILTQDGQGNTVADALATMASATHVNE